MISPFFSIIITTYNRAAMITKGLQSIVNQTFTDWEVIIIDDGSNDNTKEVISTYSNDKFRYFYQENKERSIARNNGIEKAKGQYVCFLDSDDYFLPNHLEILFSNITKNHIEPKLVYVTNRYYEDNKERRLFKHPYTSECSLEEEIIHNAIVYSPPIQCICIHNGFLSRVRFKNDWLPFYECNQFSYDLLSAGYKYAFIEDFTVVMVSHSNNTTTSSYGFYLNQYKAAKFFAKRTHVLGHYKVKEFLANQLLATAFYSKNIIDKFIFISKGIYYTPKIVCNRQSLSYIKAILKFT